MRLSFLSTKNNEEFISFLSGFKATIICYGLGLVLPVRLSEFLKPIYLKDRCKLPLSDGLAAVFLERLSDVFVLAGFAFVGVLCLLNISISNLIILSILMLVIVFILYFFDKYLLNKFEKYLTKFWLKFGINVLKSFLLRLKKKETYIGFIFGLIAWCLSFIGLIVYFKVLGITSIGMGGYLAVFLGATIGGIVPALPGGFGIYEASVVYILSKYGYGFDEALFLAVGLHLSQLIFCILGSVYLSVFEKLGILSIISEIKLVNLKNINK
jgi:uncharacterized protein (TIRG00374 family)